jgi:hypothetical protein
MWLTTVSAEFVSSSKQEIQTDPDGFWPEEEGEIITKNWSSFHGLAEICFEGEEDEYYAGQESLPLLEVVVSNEDVELKGPYEAVEKLRDAIMAACTPWIDYAHSGIELIADELAEGNGFAAVRSMGSDIDLSINLEVDEPIEPAKEAILVVLSVSFKDLSFQHLVGLVLRGTFHEWDASDSHGGSGFTADYYDAAGQCYMSFSIYGQGSDIVVH